MNTLRRGRYGVRPVATVDSSGAVTLLSEPELESGTPEIPGIPENHWRSVKLPIIGRVRFWLVLRKKVSVVICVWFHALLMFGLYAFNCICRPTKLHGSVVDSLLVCLFNGCAAMAVVLQLTCMFSDSGVVPDHFSASEQNARRLANHNEGEDDVIFECLRCNLLKPAGSHHCSKCNRCVLKMDHHCHWINNCVGAYNQRLFVQLNLHVATLSLVGVFLAVLKYPECSQRNVIETPSGVMECFEKGDYLGFSPVTVAVAATAEGLHFGVFCSFLFLKQLLFIGKGASFVTRCQMTRLEKRQLTCRMGNFHHVLGDSVVQWLNPFHESRSQRSSRKLLTAQSDSMAV